MKRKPYLIKLLLFVFVGLSLVGCKKEKITLSPSELWFPPEGSMQEINISANCGWSLSFDDEADWYTVDTRTGSGDGVIVVTAQPLGDEFSRVSSFTISSDKGKVQLKVDISQNTADPAGLQSLENLVFSVMTIAHWNTDYFGQIIEDSYYSFDYDPYDTTSGYFMYFLEGGQGVQRDNVADTTAPVYYLFTYDYNPVLRNLHIEFATAVDTVTEIYNAPVLSATEDLFRFQHEWQPNFWESADMKKVGSYTPQKKDYLLSKARKRKGGEPIFIH